MINIEREAYFENPLESRRIQAIENLNRYIEESGEKTLRPDQIDVMHSLRDYFTSGGTDGYISLPTGYGKTVLFAKLIEAIGMKAIILSPTRKILKQTHGAFGRFAPEVDISNYFSGSKDLSGTVINTTYQSLPSLIDHGRINPDEIDIVIGDEIHTALGEKRYEIFKKFPNALKIGLTATPYFGQLEGYRERGIVRADEPWIKLFENCIHEMTMEDAMELGILAPLDIHLVKTNVNVGKVNVNASGKYEERDVRRFLDTHVRSNLVVGMIKGLDAMPENIGLDQEQVAQITEIHEKIKGKKTAIFGFSIKHAQELAQILREKGVSALAVYGEMSDQRQNEVFDAYESGKTQVIIGVDLIRLGWDSPSTEVGIYLAPTQSGVVAVQELGRVLRPFPGKEKAIAIQLVDEYRQIHQSPILIPDIFDPYYVLRGTQTGRGESADPTHSSSQEKTSITVSGYRVETLIERARSAEILRSRFKQASIQDIGKALDTILAEVYDKEPTISSYALLERMSETLPYFTPSQTQEMVLQAIASIDSNISLMGKKAVIFLGARSILSAVERFLTNNQDENNEIIQAAIARVLTDLAKKDIKQLPSQAIYTAAEKGAVTHVAQREGFSANWILDDKNYTAIRNALEVLGEGIRSRGEIDEMVEDLSTQTGISPDLLRRYILFRNGLKYLAKHDMDKNIEQGDYLNPLNAAYIEDLKEDLKDKVSKALDTLKPRERLVLELRFGLKDGQKRTLEQVGKEFRLTGSRIREIETKALRKLRHPSRSRQLIDFLDYLEEPAWGWFFPPGETPRKFSYFDTFIERWSPLPETPKTHETDMALNSKQTPKAKEESTRWEEYVETNPLPEGFLLRDELRRYTKYKRYLRELGIED